MLANTIILSVLGLGIAAYIFGGFAVVGLIHKLLR